MTRSEYLGMLTDLSDAQRAKLHREYWTQFVTPFVTSCVIACISVRRIKDSKDPHFNDIPLKEWDALDGCIRPLGARINKQLNGASVWSLSDTVCAAKEAAQQIRELP